MPLKETHSFGLLIAGEVECEMADFTGKTLTPRKIFRSMPAPTPTSRKSRQRSL